MIKSILKTSTRSFSMSPTVSSASPRHLKSMLDVSHSELAALVDNAAKLKANFRAGVNTREYHQKLLGKLVAMLFTKRSTRTRVSTEGAAAFFGAQPMFLGKDDIQLGVNESIYDTTKVISSMVSCIFARVNSHADIEELCRHSQVPIVNALCDRYHPLQAITDILTIKEAFGSTQGLKLTWIGDANNVINDLTIAALKSGISVSVVTPKDIEFDSQIAAEAKKLASDGSLTFETAHDPIAALEGANVVVTDTWISMGEEAQKQAKMKQFAGFQISQEMVGQSNAASNWKFMHCLPRHPEEVADDVFYSDRSVVFAEAENRLYAAMAVLDAFVVEKGKIV